MTAETKLNGIAERCVYAFDEAKGLDAALLGGKGAGLVQMMAAGLPVPPGLVITTDACRRNADGSLSEKLWGEIAQAVRQLEQRTKRGFGTGPKPLLVSVRSGAPVSMPGMMDTVLNLGLNEETAVALARATSGGFRFAADTFTRFARMFADIVLGTSDELLHDAEFLAELEAVQDEAGLRRAVRSASQKVGEAAGEPFPTDPWDQLRRAVVAVFDSWNSRRAVRYREHHNIPHDLGTAVVVQQMVFGNLGSPSGTGVAFTRDPRNGEPKLYGEYLENGQGEDLVAGTHTPESLDAVGERYPAIISRFKSLANELEVVYRDVLDIEFTVEEGVLYFLQVRPGKRTAGAAVKIAVDLFDEGVIDSATALQRITPDQLRQVLRPRFVLEAVEKVRADGRVLLVGTGASPGQASGRIVCDPDRAEARAAAGEAVILVRTTTSPQDLHGMLAAQGIVTARGGSTSHAAVVARALDKPCIVGCELLDVDTVNQVIRVGGREFAEGEYVSIDGSTGEVFEALIPMGLSNPDALGQVGRLLELADSPGGGTVFNRVSTADMARAAISAGAQGIGTRNEELLAASDGFETLVDAVSTYTHGEAAASTTALEALEDVLTETLVKIMEVVFPKPFAARIADLSSGRAGEAVANLTDIAPSPGIWLPLGAPDLVLAQIRALVRAKESTGYPDNVILMVGGINSAAEAAALRVLCAQAGGHSLKLGVATRSPHCLLALPEIAKHVDMVWIDYRALTAACYHYPDDLVLSRGVMKSYIEDGYLPMNPANQVEEVIEKLLPPLPKLGHPCQFGVTFAGWTVSEEVVRFFTQRGFRNFGVESSELATTRLLLGRLASFDHSTIRSEKF
ncbi:MAG: pyruvate, phosphate dikinase [Burkholderiales bacterium]|nr:pyruvate, phosphate dikinase [Burkholderiales bacterium]